MQFNTQHLAVGAAQPFKLLYVECRFGPTLKSIFID